MKKLILTITLFCASLTFGQSDPLMWAWGDTEGNLRDLNNKWFNTSDDKTLFVLGGKTTLTQTGAQVQTILDGDFGSSDLLTDSLIVSGGATLAGFVGINGAPGDYPLHVYGEEIRFNDENSPFDILLRLYRSGDDGLIDLYENGVLKIKLYSKGNSWFTNQIVSNGGYTFASDTSTSDQPNIYDLVLVELVTYGAEGIHEGCVVTWKAGHTNTGAANILVNAFAQKDLFKMHDQELASGDIEAGQVVTAVYDGTQWQMTSQLAQ